MRLAIEARSQPQHPAARKIERAAAN